MKLLKFKINYWTVEITYRMAVLIKYLSDLNQKNHGSFILDTEGARRRKSRGGVRMGNVEAL